jgi:hypothetical protein
MEVISDPFTYIALAAVALGMMAWWWRGQSERRHRLVEGAWVKARRRAFGFEDINHGIVKATQGCAEALRTTQTGFAELECLCHSVRPGGRDCHSGFWSVARWIHSWHSS